MNRIIPDEESRIKEPNDAVRLVSEKIIELMGLLSRHPLANFGNFHRPLITNDLNNLGTFLQNYFKGSGQLTETRLLGKDNGK